MKTKSPGRAVSNADRQVYDGRYRVLTEHEPDVTVRTSVGGLIETVSPGVTSLLGWDPGDMVGRLASEYVHDDDVAVAERAHRDLNDGLMVQLVVRARMKSGGHRWVEATITSVVDDTGRLLARLSLLRVAHATQRVREALQQQEVFRGVIDQAPDMVLHTVDGTITWVSAAVERLTGWSRDQMMGTPTDRWVHPDDRSALRQLREQRRPDHPATARFRMLCRDGFLRWFEVISTPLSARRGHVAAVSVMRDITERVRAEEARDAMEHRLTVTLASLSDPHAYLRPIRDEAGVVVDAEFEQVNDALCCSLGCERHDVEGHCVSELLPRHKERGLVARVREVIDTGVPFTADGLRSWNDMLATHRLYDITIVPVDGVAFMCYRDVTERFEQFDAQARIRSLEALQTERERVARDLHDGAIQKVFATSMQLAALASRLPHPYRQQLDQLIEWQDAVIRDLRTTVYQLGTSGRRTSSPGRTVRDTVAEASRALGFEPRVDVDDAITLLDEVTLGHVLLVLREALSNVARHAQAHAVEVSLTLIGSEVVLDVWDDGVGLPPDLRRGNGLSNMERRAHMLGGACRLDSGPGSGTELMWRVPITASAAR